MFHILYSTGIFFVCIINTNTKSIFDLDADDIWKSIVGEIRLLPHKIPFPDIKSLLYPKKATTTSVVEQTTPSVETEGLTKYPNRKRPPEITLKDINTRKMNMNLVKLFNQKTELPDFVNGADDPSKETDRFDAIRSNTDTYKPKDFLREEYFWWENGTQALIEKNKTIELMAHYVYETRYKLPYSQLMRTKYKDDVRYKLGYCFSLLRQLKLQQRLMYTTFVNNYMHTMTLHFHMKLYEKVMRLDVDIRDLIQFIKDLEKERKVMIDPNYYDDNN